MFYLLFSGIHERITGKGLDISPCKVYQDDCYAEFTLQDGQRLRYRLSFSFGHLRSNITTPQS